MQVFAANMERQAILGDEALPVGGGGSRAWAAIGQAMARQPGRPKSLRTRGCGQRLEPFPPFTLRQPATRDLEAPRQRTALGGSQRKTTSAARWPRSPDFNLMSSSGDGSGQSGLPAAALMGG
ncbi:uncharacterized protein TrAtP1_006452 [Trichoderma atroviride]|uniref:Uncharacterized protein n=1 Tax=Hypocrea atroviridis (strain ATCC 20476 / IMI 206040) TaxID=452589 RepID=G9P9P0_HYPAI|nr:uncharacterized protein TRIATDRAFT_322807 [Trichoderma atroviride IMI 206040]EHK40362.1 hypothetical protein TRIATDRAFT_322807 [Trichoderma atroviride IMI 206040]UKZ65259.1 hypothetical protein TrAtP1_006452 [Trichoderma atroviride]